MGIITGYICAICFLLLAVKFIARKAKWERLNQILHKVHKPVSGIFLLAAIIHLCLVFPVLKTRNVLVNITGIAALVIVVLMIVLCHVMRQDTKKMFWHRMLTVILLLLIIVHIIAYFIDLGQYQSKIREINISDVDVSAVADGSYTGDCDCGYIYAKVCVTVQSGKLTNVEILEHRNERGQTAESITDKIVAQQSVDVEAVSGATNSSLVIKKACENALKKE